MLAAGALGVIMPVLSAGASTPPKVGAKCLKAGQGIQSLNLICVKKGGKLVWAPYTGGNSGGSNSGGSNSSGGGNGQGGQSSAPTLTALPVDLSQIAEISKFRSCNGHDFSGYDTDGQLETTRSMKHYFGPISSLAGATGQVKVYAPIDGTINRMDPEQSRRGTQLWIGANEYSWNVILFHLDPTAGISVGTQVKAGQLVGYANLTNAFNFDIAYQRPHPNAQAWDEDSIFNHMSPSVSAAFAAHGVNTSNVIVSKAARDASPCVDFRDHGDDFVQLTG